MNKSPRASGLHEGFLVRGWKDFRLFAVAAVPIGSQSVPMEGFRAQKRLHVLAAFFCRASR